LDPSVDPCADFYRYANGRWIEATPIPADRPGWGTFAEVYERNEKILAAALLEARDNPPPAGTAQRNVAEFFASGIDEPAAGSARRSAATIIAFETELARASMNAVERRDVDRTENRMRVADLAARAPGFPWAEYFAAAGAADLAELNVGQPAFFTALAKRA